MKLLDNFLRAKRSPEEVLHVLRGLLSRTISDNEWDDFISVKIVDPKLEEIRRQVELMWTVDSPYRLPDSIDPRDLNPKGVARVLALIADVEEYTVRS